MGELKFDHISLSLALFLGALITFLLLAFYLRHALVSHVDHTVLSWFHSLKSPALDGFFTTITWMGSLWILLPLYVLLSILLSSHIPHFEKTLGITFWGSVITTYYLKYEIERTRPHFFGPIGGLPIDPSFPSAHTAQITAFALGIALALYSSPTSAQGIGLSALLLFLVLSVAASRMYLQVHFPSDVLAGLLIASMWSIVAFWIIKSGVLK
jgi:membrane-associated phospholipid phosphatase